MPKQITIRVKKSYLDSLAQSFLNAFMGSGNLDYFKLRIAEIIYAFCVDHNIKIEIIESD